MSNARELLPEPLRPVTTISFDRQIEIKFLNWGATACDEADADGFDMCAECKSARPRVNAVDFTASGREVAEGPREQKFSLSRVQTKINGMFSNATAGSAARVRCNDSMMSVSSEPIFRKSQTGIRQACTIRHDGSKGVM